MRSFSYILICVFLAVRFIICPQCSEYNDLNANSVVHMDRQNWKKRKCAGCRHHHCQSSSTSNTHTKLVYKISKNVCVYKNKGSVALKNTMKKKLFSTISVLVGLCNLSDRQTNKHRRPTGRWPPHIESVYFIMQSNRDISENFLFIIC